MGGLFGEEGFGNITQLVTSGLEGALFAACIAGAIAMTTITRYTPDQSNE